MGSLVSVIWASLPIPIVQRGQGRVSVDVFCLCELSISLSYSFTRYNLRYLYYSRRSFLKCPGVDACRMLQDMSVYVLLILPRAAIHGR